MKAALAVLVTARRDVVFSVLSGFVILIIRMLNDSIERMVIMTGWKQINWNTNILGNMMYSQTKESSLDVGFHVVIN